MSGNRTLHRQQVSDHALWGLTCTCTTQAATTTTTTTRTTTTRTDTLSRENDKVWMIWTTGSEGGHVVYGYQVQETSLQQKQDRLEASALQLNQSGREQIICRDDDNDNDDNVANKIPSLGGSCLDTIRNYTGQDDQAGDVLLMSLDLNNVVRIWNLSSSSRPKRLPENKTDKDNNDDDDDGDLKNRQNVMAPTARFSVTGATGTAAALLPPRLVPRSSSSSSSSLGTNYDDPLERVITVAVPSLDGTIALVSTGIPVFDPHLAATTTGKKALSLDLDNNNNNKLPPAGTVLETWGSPSGVGDSVPLCLTWKPSNGTRSLSHALLTLAVGSHNGVVHLYSKHFVEAGNNSGSLIRHVRLTQLGTSPARAVTFTTDGHLLVAGNDQGRLCLWDCSTGTTTTRTGTDTISSPSLLPPPPPALVHHHNTTTRTSWILRLVPIDDRRFCSLSADHSVKLWNVRQMQHQALHEFQSHQSLWSLAAFIPNTNRNLGVSAPPRLVAGSDAGWLEIYSLDEQ